MVWTDSQHSFAVEFYFKTQESTSSTLKIFRSHFKLYRNVQSRLIELYGDWCWTSGAHPQSRKRSLRDGLNQFGPRKTSKLLKKLLLNNHLAQPEVKLIPRKFRFYRYEECSTFTLNSISTKFKLCKNWLKIIWLLFGAAVKKFFESSCSIVHQPERSSFKGYHILKSTDQNAISYTLYLCKKNPYFPHFLQLDWLKDRSLFLPHPILW